MIEYIGLQFICAVLTGSKIPIFRLVETRKDVRDQLPLKIQYARLTIIQGNSNFQNDGSFFVLKTSQL